MSRALGRGETVLVRLVERTEPARAYELATRTNDGRSVAQLLDRLVRAGLVEASGKPRMYSASERGREVNAILERITVARGGVFQAREAAGISSSEGWALL